MNPNEVLFIHHEVLMFLEQKLYQVCFQPLVMVTKIEKMIKQKLSILIA